MITLFFKKTKDGFTVSQIAFILSFLKLTWVVLLKESFNKSKIRFPMFRLVWSVTSDKENILIVLQVADALYYNAILTCTCKF